MSPSLRWQLVLFVGGLALACLWTAAYTSAFINPKPHHLPVAIVGAGPAANVAESQLDRLVPDGFVWKPMGSPAEVKSAIDHRSVYAGLDLFGRRAELLASTRAGYEVFATLSRAVAMWAKATGRRLASVDVAPLPKDDPFDLAMWFLAFTVLIPSLFVGIWSSVLGRSNRWSWEQLLLIAVYCLGVGPVEVAVGQIFNATIGSQFWLVAGVSTLFAASVSYPAALFVRIHPVGALVAVLVYIVGGLPATGGPGGAPQLLVQPFNAFARAFPDAMAYQALTNINYFHGHAVAPLAWIMAFWTAGGLLGLAGLTLWQSRGGGAPLSTTRAA